MLEIKNQTMDEERALYGLRDAVVTGCTFDGPADGESALKEAGNIAVKDCHFELRYPLWHVENFTMENSTMSDTTRAAIWYAKNGEIWNCKMHGIKAVRESEDIRIKDSDIISQEFGWKSDRITLSHCRITSEYLFLDSSNIRLDHVKMQGKYSFQYVKNMEIEDSYLDTKDAFWHTENVTVRNSVVKGEYLAWYSKNLTLIDCKIIGTQPLCYCQGLKLVGCTMVDTDLSFEYSEVEADVRGRIDSVKNPKSGRIVADEIGEIIWENPVIPCEGKVEIRNV